MYLIAGRPPEQVSPEPICERPPCQQRDPESLCTSSHISRTTSAFALPGIGYTPGFFSHDSQPASPRYVRLRTPSHNQGCNDLGFNGGLTRYDSLPQSKSRRELLPKAVLPTDLPEAEDSALIRVQSESSALKLPKAAQSSLESAQSDSVQLQAWSLVPSPSKAAFAVSDAISAEAGAASAGADLAVTSALAGAATTTTEPAPGITDVETMQRPSHDMRIVMSELVDEAADTSTGTAQLLGAFAPVRLAPSVLPSESAGASRAN